MNSTPKSALLSTMLFMFLQGASIAQNIPPNQARADADLNRQRTETIGKNEQPIHDAARMGTRQDVEKLLKASPQSRDARTDLGATPLHYAALNEDSGPLLALIAAGANVNSRDKEGMTPLHMAAFSTRTKHARPLLEAGADPALKTNAGRDVLSMARKVRADEFSGVVSLWLLKGCKPSKPC